MVDIILDEELINHSDEYDVIIVGTNCYQSMANGLQLDIAKKYDFVKKANNKTKYGDINKLGSILECYYEKTNTRIILAYISFGYNFKGGSELYCDYNAITKCLKLINLLHHGKRIATTFIGATEFDGNADREKILTIINNTMTDTDVTIFDYKQLSKGRKNQKEFHKMVRENRKKYIDYILPKKMEKLKENKRKKHKK